MEYPKFYGVNECHTFQIPNDSDNFFVGMNVQGTTTNSDEEIVLIFSPEQIFDMYNYMVNRLLTKDSDENE